LGLFALLSVESLDAVAWNVRDCGCGALLLLTPAGFVDVIATGRWLIIVVKNILRIIYIMNRVIITYVNVIIDRRQG
jgi:hypothetical protein